MIINGRSLPEDCLEEVRKPYGDTQCRKKVKWGLEAVEVAFPSSLGTSFLDPDFKERRIDKIQK